MTYLDSKEKYFCRIYACKCDSSQQTFYNTMTASLVNEKSVMTDSHVICLGQENCQFRFKMSYLSATHEGISLLLFMTSRTMATPFAIFNFVDLLLRRILSFV